MKLQAYKKWGFTVTNYKEYKKYMKCTHETYNELCVTCLDIEAHAGYATKEGFANFDADSDWSDKVEYYNRPEPEPDEEEDYNHAERNAIEE
jgi:transcription elongation factor Elf1